MVSNALLGKLQTEPGALIAQSEKPLTRVEPVKNVQLVPTVILQVSKPVSNVTPERALKRDQSR